MFACHLVGKAVTEVELAVPVAEVVAVDVTGAKVVDEGAVMEATVGVIGPAVLIGRVDSNMVGITVYCLLWILIVFLLKPCLTALSLMKGVPPMKPQ